MVVVAGAAELSVSLSSLSIDSYFWLPVRERDAFNNKCDVDDKCFNEVYMRVCVCLYLLT